MCWTITTGTGKSAGSDGSTVISALGPPVETPIATTSIGPSVVCKETALFDSTLDSRKSRGGANVAKPERGGGAGTMTRPQNILILGISWACRFWIAAPTLPTLAGLVT